MKKIFESVQNFKTKRQEIIAKYEKDLQVVERNFKKGSDYYNERMKSMKEERDAAISLLQATGLEEVKKELATVRSRIEKVDYTSISPETEKLIGRIGNMTDTEKAMVLKNFKGSYQDKRMVFEAMQQPFMKVDDVMEDVEYLEESLNDYFKNYSPDSYNHKSIEHGAMFETFEETVNNFMIQCGEE